MNNLFISLTTLENIIKIARVSEHDKFILTQKDIYCHVYP